MPSPSQAPGINGGQTCSDGTTAQLVKAPGPDNQPPKGGKNGYMLVIKDPFHVLIS